MAAPAIPADDARENSAPAEADASRKSWLKNVAIPRDISPRRKLSNEEIVCEEPWKPSLASLRAPLSSPRPRVAPREVHVHVDLNVTTKHRLHGHDLSGVGCHRPRVEIDVRLDVVEERPETSSNLSSLSASFLGIEFQPSLRYRVTCATTLLLDLLDPLDLLQVATAELKLLLLLLHPLLDRPATLGLDAQRVPQILFAAASCLGLRAVDDVQRLLPLATTVGFCPQSLCFRLLSL